MHSIGEAATAKLIQIRFETVGGEVACLVDVKPSSSAVYAKTTKGDNVFYVRVGNTTRILEGPELVEYVAGHWA